ncbi:NAD(P)H-dependent oxidoreductase [Sporolactobacillus shoreicorticis]|uniref:NAD(P)H-dependent oxidoreductase n=1 Tax=Sporolactobacillus shoreicorticis TaxID=1923877 RepID=A0ABW5S0Q4_9BACL|nr:NAD(P)H-dependent oxidoreductase [Sporolactobacillus shoreicorticis]MCO7124508.1 NAD(P)H-dependent oxidoreductase [Sporolactobacillus shoreicorticis]
MKTLIIIAHPYKKSFNFAILDALEKSLSKKKKTYEIIDLYEDRFNPVYTEEELSLFSSGQTTDELVTYYQSLLKNSAELIVVSPIWWNDLPAILKGFFDKVMKYKFAYHDTKTGIKGHLSMISQATIITTSKSPTWYLKWFAGNAVKKVFIKATLKQLGIRHAQWINFGNIKNATLEQRKQFLANLKEK